jgi:hypothetical protein
MTNKKIRLIRTMVTEYEPEPSHYPEGATIEEMANIDATADDIEAVFDNLTSDRVKYEIIDGKEAVTFQADAIPNYLNDESSSDSMKRIYDDMKKIGASDYHFTANQIFKDKKASGVIAVYNGIKPAYMVLNEMIEYAEKHGHKIILELVDALQNDLSFLNEPGNITTEEE